MGIRSYLIVALLVAAGVPAVAHHSFAAFDQTREVTMKGQVTQFQWTNPHSWLVVRVKLQAARTRNGPSRCSVPMCSGAMGWTRESVKVGDQVTVTANPAKDGTHFGLMLAVLDAEGRPIGGKVPK